MKEEVPKWAISVDEFPGGRCYLSRNAYLRRWLKTTGRLAKTNEKPDILYAQVCYGALPDLGQEMTAVQSVTYVSEEVSKIEKIAAAELKITVSCCSAATIVVTHGDVHASTLKAVGVDEEKIIKVRPAPSIRAPMINKNLSSTIIGYAGQNIPRKRIGWARIAAKEAGCEILITNTTKFNMMSKWYNKIGLVVVPSTGESWSMVVSEAIAHGVPAVVAPNVGASEEIMETGAGLVSLEDTLDRFVEVVSSAMKMDTYLDLRNNAIVAPIRMMSTWARELVNSVENEWRKRC